MLTNCVDLYLARIGRPDILWSVNKLARAVAKWAQACDRRLARLMSNIDHTRDYRQCCHVGNTAQHCRLSLFQDSDFAGDLEDSKSTSGEYFVHLEVEHSSLQTGCVSNRLRYLTAPLNLKSYLWKLDYGWRSSSVRSLGHCYTGITVIPKLTRNLLSKLLATEARYPKSKQSKTNHREHPAVSGNGNVNSVDQLSHVDHVPSNAQSCQGDFRR